MSTHLRGDAVSADAASLARYERIARELATLGWSVCPAFLDTEALRDLSDDCRALWERGAFRHARVGVGTTKELRPEIRTDHVRWIDEETSTPVQRRYLGELESLRQAINRHTYLGLFGFEGHLTVYPPGTFYRRHLDQFRGVHHRVVSVVLYLNIDWDESAGGSLRLFPPEAGPDGHVDVAPIGGTLVAFLSAHFEHEVLPATRDRMSITGWFRTR
jgi:SM-20-related protein